MGLTEKDERLTRWMGEMYACQVDHAARFLGVKPVTARWRLDRLVDWETVGRLVVLHGQGPWYYPTREGLRWVGLPYRVWVPKPSAVAHLPAVLDVSLDVQERYPDAEWVGERVIRRRRSQAARMDGRGSLKVGHAPDGELVFPDGRRVAVEVELSRKSPRRLEQILSSLISVRYDAVWWFASPEVVPGLERLRERKAAVVRAGFGFVLEVLG
jgi:hypothetical protein